MNLKERADRTTDVIERFRDKPFAWGTRGNCIHLAKAQAKAMGVRTRAVPKFSTYAGAVKALKSTGHNSLEELLDWYFPRIPSAKMIVGDIAMLPGLAPFNALVIAAGGQKVLGWHESDMSRMWPIEVTKAEIVAAWAVGR
jgi:hypothetical protein